MAEPMDHVRCLRRYLTAALSRVKKAEAELESAAIAERKRFNALTDALAASEARAERLARCLRSIIAESNGKELQVPRKFVALAESLLAAGDLETNGAIGPASEGRASAPPPRPLTGD